MLSLVEELCASIAVMSRGPLVFAGTADELRTAASAAPGSPLDQAFVWVAAPGEAGQT